MEVERAHGERVSQRRLGPGDWLYRCVWPHVHILISLRLAQYIEPVGPSGGPTFIASGF